MYKINPITISCGLAALVLPVLVAVMWAAGAIGTQDRSFIAVFFGMQIGLAAFTAKALIEYFYRNRRET